MRRRLVSVLAFSTLLSLAAFASPVGMTNSPDQHGFSIKEYEAFHQVLHPLEHDALPKKDFPRIRAKAGELVKRGRAIVKLGVPGGTSEKNKEEFARELKRFGEVLVKFRAEARTGTDDQLKASYSSVHDSFEMLAGMLPRG